MGSRAVVLVCRDLDARGPGSARPGRARCRLDAYRSAVLRRDADRSPDRPHLARPGRSRPACSTSWAPAGCCSTPSCCRGRRRPGSLLRDQYAAVGAAARAALPAAVSVLEQAAAGAGSTFRPAGATRLGSPTPRPSPPPTGATAGRPTVWTASSSRRSRCSPRRARPTRPSRTAGTSTWLDRLVAADPRTFRATGRLYVDTDRPGGGGGCDGWWERADRRRRRGHGRQAVPPT